MLLSAAFLPPASVLTDIRTLQNSAEARACQLEVVPAPELQMSVSVFGNVARAQVSPIATALRRAAEKWPTAPTLRFAGGAALEWPGDTSVWVRTSGDFASLEALARSIAPAVNRLGYAVDRRRFHPLLPFARITPATDLAPLEKLLARLDAYQGPEWTVDRLTLLRVTFDASDPSNPNRRGFEVVDEIPLPKPGGGADHEPGRQHWAVPTASRA